MRGLIMVEYDEVDITAWVNGIEVYIVSNEGYYYTLDMCKARDDRKCVHVHDIELYELLSYLEKHGLGELGDFKDGADVYIEDDNVHPIFGYV